MRIPSTVFVGRHVCRWTTLNKYTQKPVESKVIVDLKEKGLHDVVPLNYVDRRSPLKTHYLLTVNPTLSSSAQVEWSSTSKPSFEEEVTMAVKFVYQDNLIVTTHLSIPFQL